MKIVNLILQGLVDYTARWFCRIFIRPAVLWTVIVFAMTGMQPVCGEDAPLALTVREAPPKPFRTRIAVSIENNGKYTYKPSASGLPQELEMTVDEFVEVLDGDYSGWGFGMGTYLSGPHRGSVYFVRHDDEERGVLTGSIQGTLRRPSRDEPIALGLDAIDGKPRQEKTHLIPISANPGKKTNHSNVMLLVFKDVVLATEPGENAYEQRTTLLHLPAADGRPHDMRRWKGAGAEFGEYREGAGAGSVWIYLINRAGMGEPVSPQRYGAWEGPRRGAFMLSFPGPLKQGSPATLRSLPAPTASSSPKELQSK